MFKILVTGGAGYIGSHTCLSLLLYGYELVVLDNFSNSSSESLRRVEKLANSKIKLFEGDVCNRDFLDKLFSKNQFDAVIHFAGLKAVNQSIKKPIEYYQNNMHGSLNLLEIMARYRVENFIFSSSATVYGEDADVPYTEAMKLGNPSSPYGRSKVIIENIIEDVVKASPSFKAISLRYFNPIGAHPSGLIGEDPNGMPNNLLPFLSQVAVGERRVLEIFGNDYPTKDGTCRRDYVHVVDLAEGHLKSLNFLLHNKQFKGFECINLGTGEAVSVLEIVTTFITETGIDIPYIYASRREGDLPEFWADTTKAKKLIGWQAKLTLSEMIRDSWNWQSKNPKGYPK